MDTNKNVGINEFSGGMNFDLNYNTLQHNLYIYGENIRLTSNALINQGENPDKKEGVVSPIPEGILILAGNIAFNKILAIEQIDNICVVIVENVNSGNHTWSVHRITYNANKTISIANIFNSTEARLSEIPKFSTVINKEVNGIIKLYIADGENEIMVLNVNSDYDQYNSQITESQLISNNYFPKNKVGIINTISGRLPVGLVQYTYRFYKKYSIKSKLAPLTNKIQIINSTKNKEQGNAEDTTTSMGLLLRIDYDDECKKLFDKVQIFRIYYKLIDVDADIELIYDEKINADSSYIKLNDVGKDALKEYTAEEFSLLDGQDIVPQCIEHNQGYMFAANVLDKTIINKELGEFDARAFSANSNGVVVLYADTDTEYQDAPITFPIGYVDTTSPNAIQLSEIQLYTLNMYADMNVDATGNAVCKYDEAGFLGGTGRYVSWRFVTTRIPIDLIYGYESQAAPHTAAAQKEPLFYLKNVAGSILKQAVEISGTQITSKDVFNQHGIDISSKITYEDSIVSSLLKSLRRGEVYRYGIILYDKNGRRSDVNWIADIKTPTAKEFSIIESSYNPASHLQQGIIDNWCYSSFDGIDVARNGDNENKKTYTASTTGSTGSFSTNGGEYIYFNKDSSIIDFGTVEIYQYSRIWGAFEGPRNTLQTISLDGENVLLQNLSSFVENKQANHPWYGAVQNFVVSFSNITVLYDGNLLPLDEYNESSARLVSHNDVQVKTTVTISFDITAKDFGAYVAITNIVSDIYISPTPYEEQDMTAVMYARPIGILFDVKNLPEEIVGYQIVRCSKNPEYRKNVMLCVTSIPIRQQITETGYSPYYPHYLLTTNPYRIENAGLFGEGAHHIYGKLATVDNDDPSNNTYDWYDVKTETTPKLFLLYSPEITNRRDDALLILSDTEDIEFFEFFGTNHYLNLSINNDNWITCYKDLINGIDYQNSDYDKASANIVTRYYERQTLPDGCVAEVKKIQDTKNPLWEDAYSNVLLGSVSSGDDNDTVGVTSATKQYKSYVTSINDKEYVNWICNAMYDIKAFEIDVNKNQHYDGWAIVGKDDLAEYKDDEREWYKKAFDLYGDSKEAKLSWIEDNVYFDPLPLRVPSNTGFVGPGPVCFIADINTDGTLINNITKRLDGKLCTGTAIANLRHRPIQYAGLSNSDKTLDVYYGFGNFYTTEIDNQNHVASGSSFVFDGDVYIVPFEIVQMFKAYDFNSDDTLLSALFVYYIPIETPINTYFDYGMNYRNTLSKTLLLEPGEISGVSSQDRPLSQYSMILSDNSTSNDIYNARYNEDETSEFKCRIWFSNQKISGEYIDNWLIYSPLDYTDGDSRFGDITCLTSMKDAIYCWQDRAFGRISVNERSLVKDTNSNMIQLGTGGVVQRVDYIDTIHGMSPNQYVCEDVANRIFWIDDKNKVVMMSDGTSAINLSEQTNVQGLLNGRFNNEHIAIGYDSQSDELLCKCLNDGQQLVFNTKLNLATSVYTRNYLETFRMHNELFGINNAENKLNIYKFGGTNENETISYMPSVLLFVVNDNSSVTKVFDNQEIVFTEANNDVSSFNEHSVFKFDTNTTAETTQCCVDATYYEGNVRYAIPRELCADYGQRMRGKWLRVSIGLDGSILNAISHVLTKFRQSF